MQRLQGCLADLPERLRLVLQLMTGVNAPSALAPAVVARHVHVGVGQIFRVEKRALRRLRVAARKHTCGRVAQTASPQQTLAGLRVPTGFGPALGDAAGGVEALRFQHAPSQLGSNPPEASPSGANLPAILSVAGNPVPAILALLAAALVIGLLFADGLGLGPRHSQWRARWLRRPPR